MARISRKELKTDEFATEVSKTYEFLQRHREALTRTGVVAGAILVVAAGFYFFLQHRRGQAEDELGHAIRVYYAPLAAESGPEQDLKFADEKARYQQAEKEFAAIADKYSWLRPGLIARYYLGLAKARLGKSQEAIRTLEAVAAKGDDRYSPLARFALAGLYTEMGKADQAQKIYRQLADQPSPSVPKETALLALAESLSQSKPAEAQKIYQDIKKQAEKGSAAGELADERLAELKKQ